MHGVVSQHGAMYGELPTYLTPISIRSLAMLGDSVSSSIADTHSVRLMGECHRICAV